MRPAGTWNASGQAQSASSRAMCTHLRCSGGVGQRQRRLWLPLCWQLWGHLAGNCLQQPCVQQIWDGFKCWTRQGLGSCLLGQKVLEAGHGGQLQAPSVSLVLSVGLQS